MRKLFTIFFGLLVMVGVGTGSAQSGDATFKFTNNASLSIMMKFFSQGRDWQWPSHTTHWTLDDDAEHPFTLGCQDGEQICYGGSYTADDTTHWGVGLNGDKACQGCCLTCGSTHSWNLNEAPASPSGGVPID